MLELAKDSPVPLYYQLKEGILAMIESGDLKPGDPIPSERDLCARHGISRMTASKAVSALVDEGILYRERGKGTFVSGPKPTCTSSLLTGFTENIRDAGLRAETRILSFEEEDALRHIREALRLPVAEARVFNVLRLRFVEDEPFSLEQVWMPVRIFPGFSRDVLEGRSLYALMRERYGFRLAYARQTIEPVLCSEYESELLELEPGAPVLLFRRTTFAEPDVPVEYSKCLYRGKRFKYEVSFSA